MLKNAKQHPLGEHQRRATKKSCRDFTTESTRDSGCETYVGIFPDWRRGGRQRRRLGGRRRRRGAAGHRLSVVERNSLGAAGALLVVGHQAAPRGGRERARSRNALGHHHRVRRAALRRGRWVVATLTKKNHQNNFLRGSNIQYYVLKLIWSSLGFGFSLVESCLFRQKKKGGGVYRPDCLV